MITGATDPGKGWESVRNIQNLRHAFEGKFLASKVENICILKGLEVKQACDVRRLCP